jgi:putative lipoprotein
VSGSRVRTVRCAVVLPEGEEPVAADELVVQVEDVSRADAPSTVVGERRLRGVELRPGAAVPVAVEVPAVELDEGAEYSVRVHVDVSGSGDVEVGDLVSTQTYPVLTHGYGDEARVVVRRVG